MLLSLISFIILNLINLSSSSSYEVLSKHRAIATFDGIEFYPCRFRTALCPDRCGHSKYLASFTIVEYEEYEKLGEYGDEKQEKFLADTNPNAAEDRQSSVILEQIKLLKPGQKVRLTWEHIYVNNDTAMYPERPIRSIEVIE